MGRRTAKHGAAASGSPPEAGPRQGRHPHRSTFVKVRFLADADLNRAIVSGVLRREPSLDFLTAAANLRGMADHEVLELAAKQRRVSPQSPSRRPPRPRGLRLDKTVRRRLLHANQQHPTRRKCRVPVPIPAVARQLGLTKHQKKRSLANSRAL